MRSEEDARKARKIINETVIRDDLNTQQRTMLAGMSVALQWMCEEGGHALQEIVDGMPFAPKDESQTIEFGYAMHKAKELRDNINRRN